MEIFVSQNAGLLTTLAQFLSLALLYCAVIIGIRIVWTRREWYNGLLLSIAVLVSGVFTFYFLSPCYQDTVTFLSVSRPYNFENGKVVNIKGDDPSVTDFTEIKAAINSMSDRLYAKIKIIALREANHFGKDEAAHVGCGHGVICVQRNGITSEIIQHEAGHLYTYYCGTAFVNSWKQIAGPGVYGSMARLTLGGYQWNNGGDGPRYGCVSPYGSKNAHEDIATFYEYVCSLRPPHFSLIDFLRLQSAMRHDQRFQQKINLLHENGFLDDQEFQSLKSLLGF